MFHFDFRTIHFDFLPSGNYIGNTPATITHPLKL